MLKRTLLSVAAILGVSGGAVAADLLPMSVEQFEEAFSPNSAIVSAWAGAVRLQTDDSDFNRRTVFTAGGDARAYHETGPGWGAQMELSTVIIGDVYDGSGGQTIFDVTGGAHLISRRDENTAHGAFAALSYTTHAAEDDASWHIMGGVEGSMFRDMTQIFGLFGGQYAIAGDRDDTWSGGIFGTVGARHFYGEDKAVLAQISLGGLGQWDDGTRCSSCPRNGPPVWSQWILEYEHQMGVSGLSGFVAYQGDLIYDLDNSSWDDHLINHAFKIGLRGNFGAGGSLYSIAKHGAGTFNLPDLHMPYSFTDDLW